MTTTADPNDSIVTVFAWMRAKPGRQEELRLELDGLVADARTDPGFLTYDLHEGLDDPQLFCFYEHWASAEDLAAHSRTAAQDTFRARVADLVDGGVTVHRVRRV